MAHRLRMSPFPRSVLILFLALPLAAAGSVEAQEASPKWQAIDGPGGRLTLLAGAQDGRELYAVSEVGVNRQGDQTQWRDAGVPTESDALYASRDSGELASGHERSATRLDYRPPFGQDRAGCGQVCRCAAMLQSSATACGAATTAARRGGASRLTATT